MKGVIFLDIDGVVNSARWLHYLHENQLDICRRDHLEPAAVAKLNRLAVYDFVLSSSWRHVVDVEEMQEMLAFHGFTGRLVGRTPFGSEMRPDPNRVGYARGYEIQQYLDDHPCDRFVILDDSCDMAHLMPYLVRTTWQDGLHDEHVNRALRMLEAK